jgi:hypothetical protein
LSKIRKDFRKAPKTIFRFLKAVREKNFFEDFFLEETFLEKVSSKPPSKSFYSKTPLRSVFERNQKRFPKGSQNHFSFPKSGSGKKLF